VRTVARAGWLLLAVSLGLAGASRGPKPGTGDIAFRLSWQGPADLDLYVVAPDGERIDFIHREASSGGLLDIDCNVTLVDYDADRGSTEAAEYRKLRCPQPLENVYWPRGRAPSGRYRVQVLLADGEGAEASDRYRLEILLGRRIHRAYEGAVLELDDAPLAVETDFPPVSPNGGGS